MRQPSTFPLCTDTTYSTLVTKNAQIGGSLVPLVGPFDEFDGEDECDGEGELGEAVDDAPVGVPSELSVVREPRVGALNGPPHPERRGFRFRRGASFAFACTDQVVDTGVSDEDSCWLVVVASVEVERLDVDGEASAGDGVEGGAKSDKHTQPSGLGIDAAKFTVPDQFNDPVTKDESELLGP